MVVGGLCERAATVGRTMPSALSSGDKIPALTVAKAGVMGAGVAELPRLSLLSKYGGDMSTECHS